MFNRRRSGAIIKISFFFMLLSFSKRVWLKEPITSKACSLPKGCRVGSFHKIEYIFSREFISAKDSDGIICNANNNMARLFDGFDARLAQIYSNSSCFKSPRVSSLFDLRFPRDLNTKLNKNLNLIGILEFMNYTSDEQIYDQTRYTIHLTNVGGFSVELNKEKLWLNFSSSSQIGLDIKLIRANVQFYEEGKLLKSCSDLMSANNQSWSPTSIFQIVFKNAYSEILFFNCRFK